MIGADEITAALDKINPQHAAVGSIAEAFGNNEAMPLMRDIMGGLDVDADAVRELALVQLAYYIGEGDSLELAAHKVNALILGFTTGVAAAREEASSAVD